MRRLQLCLSACCVCVCAGKGGRSVAVLLDVAERENREERRGTGAVGARKGTDMARRVEWRDNNLNAKWEIKAAKRAHLTLRSQSSIAHVRLSHL